jgi:hypothetical protein
MSRHAPLLCALTIAPLLAAAQAPAPLESGISIRVAQGDGAINSIRLRRGHDPAVQVLDRSGEPLSSATVTFLLPATGPSGTFQNSGLSLTVQTDARGMATSRGVVPNRIAGPFRIRVTASWRGQAASATLAQTNVEPVAASSRGKKIAIIALIAGGVAGGVAVAASRGGGSTATPGGSTGGTGGGGTIVAGAPSIGPPH